MPLEVDVEAAVLLHEVHQLADLRLLIGPDVRLVEVEEDVNVKLVDNNLVPLRAGRVRTDRAAVPDSSRNGGYP
jgi:hypothetical protein